MKVLWFEVTTPSSYDKEGSVVGGWQDSLENIVRSIQNIQLAVSFDSGSKEMADKIVDGVAYYPLNVRYSRWEQFENKMSWTKNSGKLIECMLSVVKKFSPDIIHVFGTEWPYGLISKYTSIPVVIHIQGSIIPYNNALYPPNYNEGDCNFSFFSIRKNLSLLLNRKKEADRASMEKEIWQSVKYYMGRTNWDYALSAIMNKNRVYFHVEEALRGVFISSSDLWKPLTDSKIVLFSTGCSSFWKGPDMMLKTASILKEMGLKFEWLVAGAIPGHIKSIVERKENKKFEDNNISFLGWTSPEKIKQLLLDSSLYVHTAYIENSPNSICEAQCLGVPVVSTNVGGISTLLNNGEAGILIPANDPWQMAFSIADLLANNSKALVLSKAGRELANKRHDAQLIASQLLNCYSSILSN